METPIETEKGYRALVRRIHKACDYKCDVACINPSRLSRFPGAIRKEKGKTQKLLYVGQRIKNEELEAWLISRGALPEVKKDQVSANSFVYTPFGLSPFTQNFIMFGCCKEGEFNQTLFKSGLDLARNKYPFEKAVALIEKGIGEPLDSKSYRSLEQAYSYVGDDEIVNLINSTKL